MMVGTVFFIEKRKKKKGELEGRILGESEKLEKQRENRKKRISRGIFSL